MHAGQEIFPFWNRFHSIPSLCDPIYYVRFYGICSTFHFLASLLASSSLYIGLDAGGSTTELLGRLVPDANGDQGANGNPAADLRLQGPGTNPNRVGTEEAARRLAALVRQALQHHPAARLASVYAGIAGAGSDEEQHNLALRLRRALGGDAPASVHVVHDALIALEAAFGAGSGLIAIAGTGSVVFARATDGSVRRSGGWGYAIGDEGSGYALGCAALRAIAHTFDGGPPTRLRALLAEEHGLATREAIIQRVYHTKWPLQEAAGLVLRAAAAGDAVAQRIIEEQTTALARQVAWLAEQEPPVEPRLALIGGLTNEAVYVEALHAALHRALPEWTIHSTPDAPVTGALRLALRNGCS